MKYITTQLTFKDGLIHIEPIYNPATSLGEGITLRLITGNVRPTQISALIEGFSSSKRFALRETYPTVFEVYISAKDFRDILSDELNKYKIKFYITIDNREYVYTTDEILFVQGLSFGKEHLTDISDLYSRLKWIEDELHRRTEGK